MRSKCRTCMALLIIAIMMLGVCAGCKKEGDGGGTENTTLTPTAGEDSDKEEGHDKIVGEYEAYTEAPMLQALVEERKLPTSEKRLPMRESVYTENSATLGLYGEDVQFAIENAVTLTGELVSEGLFRYAEDGTIAPNVAKAYTVNSDFTKYTI